MALFDINKKTEKTVATVEKKAEAPKKVVSKTPPVKKTVVKHPAAPKVASPDIQQVIQIHKHITHHPDRFSFKIIQIAPNGHDVSN